VSQNPKKRGDSPQHDVLLPAGWTKPRGYANGIRASGDMVFVAGMIGWDTEGRLAKGFVAQTRKLLQNIVVVLAEGGARPEHIVRMTWYVVDLNEYRAAIPEVGAVYREIMGAHYPAMALVEVKGLVEPEARLEVEATALVPPG
jgi:enamine deaminase RidA (YjgF/YER057c/UK114 family)